MKRFAKKISLFIFLGAVVFGAFSPSFAFVAQAQQATDNSPSALQWVLDPSGSAAQVAANAAGNKVAQVANNVGQSIISSLGDIIKRAVAYFAYLALFISSWILGIVGLLFDAIMTYTVVDMQANYTSYQVINTAWADMRSIGNIVFIFMAIYLGITTIINSGGAATKKLVVQLIVVALLVNFSLFFTKLVVDASNVLTVSFYNLVLKSGNGYAGTAGITGDASHGINSAQSFSAAFAGPLGVMSLYNFPSPTLIGAISNTSSNSNTLSNLNFTTILLVGIGGSFFLILTAVTFLSTAILFLVRFVVLIFLMILSPLAFLFYALPRLKPYAEMWQGWLVSQLSFGVVYMILIFFVVLIIHGASSHLSVSGLVNGLLNFGSNGQNAIAGTVVADTGCGATSLGTVVSCVLPIKQILFFLVIIGLMITALYLSIRSAAAGGGVVGWLVNKTSGAFVGGTLSLAGKTYRGTVGRTTEKLTGEGSKFGEKIRGMKTSNNFLTRAVGRRLDKSATTVREATGDLRNLKSVQNLNKKAGLDTGKGAEGGYKARVEAEKKEIVESVKKAGGGATKETVVALQASQTKLAEANNKYATQMAQEQRILAMEARGNLTPEQTAEIQAHRRAKTALSQDIRDAAKEVKRTTEKRDAERKSNQVALLDHFSKWSGVTSAITGQHRESVRDARLQFMTKEKAADKAGEEKAKIDGFAEDLRTALAADDEEQIKKIVKNDIGQNDFKKLPGNLLANPKVYKHLKPSVRKGVKSANLSNSDLEKIERIEDDERQAAAQNNPAPQAAPAASVPPRPRPAPTPGPTTPPVAAQNQTPPSDNLVG